MMKKHLTKAAAALGICILLGGCVSVGSRQSGESGKAQENTGNAANAGEDGNAFADKGERVQYFTAGSYQYVMYEDSKILGWDMSVRDLETSGLGTELRPSDIGNCPASSIRSILCQKPGCLHSAQDKDCPYNWYTNIERTFISSSGAAFFNYDGDDGSEELYVMNIDGSDIKMVKEWQGVGVTIEPQAVLVGEKLYFFVYAETQSMDENGYIETEKAVGELYCLDMEKQSLSLLYQTEDTYGMQGGDLYYDQGTLALCIEFKNKSLEDAGLTVQEYYEKLANDLDFVSTWDTLFDMTYRIILYDIEAGEAQTIDMKADENGVPYLTGVWNGNLILNSPERLYLQNIESGEETMWIDLEDGYSYSGATQCADFVLVEAIPDNSYEDEYYLCRYGETDLHPLKLPYDANIRIYFESDTMLYLALYPKVSESQEEDWAYRLITKTEIFGWLND